MNKLIPILSVVVLMAAGWVYGRQLEQPTTKLEREVNNLHSDNVGGTIPFGEMTIPYLREREYLSTLGEMTRYGSAGEFDTYLTSYDSDGLKINGLLTIPKGERPESGWPAVVFVHGYIAPSTYRTTEKYVDYVNFLARNGLVVFKIDLRGHGESEGSPGGAYYSSDYVIDTLNAVAALRNSEHVNPEKIGLWGHSMAGNVTFRAFVAAQDIPKLVVWAGAGFSYEDLQKYGLNDNSYRPPATTSERRRRRDELRAIYGDFSVDSDFWRQVVPTNYLTDVKGAVQLHHAKDDSVVKIGYSRDLKLILDSNGIRNEVYEYSSGGHNLTGIVFGQAMTRTVEFLKNEL